MMETKVLAGLVLAVSTLALTLRFTDLVLSRPNVTLKDYVIEMSAYLVMWFSIFFSTVVLSK